MVTLDRGPASIESEYEEALAAPDIVTKAREAEARGADAVVVSCMLDPGVAAAREVVSIPVFGPCQVSMHMAAMLGECFSVVTVLDRLVPLFRKRARVYGVGASFASARAIGVPVLDLDEDSGQTVRALADESMEAIDSDGADVVVLGCTGMAGMSRAVATLLLERGYEVPVIDPGTTTLKVAEAVADLGLTHSKTGYPFPPAKRMVGYPPVWRDAAVGTVTPDT